MEREYFVRDRRVVVEQIDDVVAIQRESEAQAAPEESLDEDATAAVRDASPEVGDETMAAFARANWLFVRPGSSEWSAAASTRGAPGTQAVGSVVRRENGSVAVVTDVVNAQVDPGLAGDDAERVLADAGLDVINRLNFAPNLYEARAVGWRDAIDASAGLHDDPRFVFVEPALVEHIPQRAAPTDPDYAQQWQWANTGANGGTAGADVSAQDAWDHTQGAGMRVAVIDNGFDVGHDDLAAGVGPMSGFFTAGAGGAAATFTQGAAGMPDEDHGTFCAGMVGARRNNGAGGVGAAPDCELSLIACLTDQIGTQTTLARAVAYAANPAVEVAGADPADGADILVSSLGPNGAVWDLSAVLDLALQNAAANGRGGLGMCIFWAASNGNNVDVMQDEVVSHADVIAVVRSDNNDMENNAARGAEVELIAPGVNVYSTRSGNGYGTDTGTSFAAPCAAGCAALALSVNPDLARNGLREIMRATADQVGGVVYDANGHNDDYGFGRVNAFRAVERAARRVRLVTTSVVFNDVPQGETTARAIVWEASALAALTFEVVSGPTVTSGPPGSFGLLLGPSVTIPAPGALANQPVRLWFVHTGTTAGATAAGQVTVRCIQTGEQWTVPLTANTIARPTAAVVMVLDQSGSMGWDAGDGRTRVEVLRESAHALVDVLHPDTGIGVVRFDHDAYLGMAVAGAGPETFGPGRAQAAAAVAGHAANNAGATSIGDGVEMAGAQLDGVTSTYDELAMIVLTDGQENAPKLISEVAGNIDDKVFAIGLGEPTAINPAALSALTNGTGGYVSMTGVLSQDERFVLAKYYLQILAGVTNQEIVLDPSGHLGPAATTAVPFVLNRSDTSADAILLCPAPWAMRVTLETPSGEVLSPGALPAGVSFVTGQTASYFRFNLPVVDAGGREHWAGFWQLHIECERSAFRKYLQSLERDHPKEYEHVAAHGLQWAVEIHSRSNLRMAARVDQDHTDPGATMHLSAQLTEFGIPLNQKANVHAEVTGPAGGTTIELGNHGDGSYATTYTAHQYGLYRFRVVAEGRSTRGERFTRERTLDGWVYVPRPAQDDPKPPKKDEDGDGRPGAQDCAEVLAALQTVLRRERALAKALDREMAEQGSSLVALLRCVGGDAGGGGGGERPDLGGLLRPPLRPLPIGGRHVPRRPVDGRTLAETLRAVADAVDDTGE
jgi:hypothetical protein